MRGRDFQGEPKPPVSKTTKSVGQLQQRLNKRMLSTAGRSARAMLATPHQRSALEHPAEQRSPIDLKANTQSVKQQKGGSKRDHAHKHSEQQTNVLRVSPRARVDEKPRGWIQRLPGKLWKFVIVQQICVFEFRVFFFNKSSLQKRHCQERQRQPTGVAVDIEERESPVNARCSDRSEFHTEADL